MVSGEIKLITDGCNGLTSYITIGKRMAIGLWKEMMGNALSVFRAMEPGKEQDVRRIWFSQDSTQGTM